MAVYAFLVLIFIVINSEKFPIRLRYPVNFYQSLRALERKKGLGLYNLFKKEEDFFQDQGSIKKLISCEPETLMKFFLQKIFTYFYKHPHEAQSFYEVFTLISPCPASLKWLARGLWKKL